MPDAMSIDAAVRLVALAGSVKPKQLAAAKALIPDGSAHQVNFVAQIEGAVTKGATTPAGTTTRQPRIDTTSMAVVADVLRRLKCVDPAKLRRAIRAAAKANLAADLAADPINATIIDQFQLVADRLTEQAEPVVTATPGRAGSVRPDTRFNFVSTTTKPAAA